MGYISDTRRENFSVEILWKLFSCRAYSQSVVIYANKSLSRFFLFFCLCFFWWQRCWNHSYQTNKSSTKLVNRSYYIWTLYLLSWGSRGKKGGTEVNTACLFTGLDTLVLERANSKRSVCETSGSNRTPLIIIFKRKKKSMNGLLIEAK